MSSGQPGQPAQHGGAWPATVAYKEQMNAKRSREMYEAGMLVPQPMLDQRTMYMTPQGPMMGHGGAIAQMQHVGQMQMQHAQMQPMQMAPARSIGQHMQHHQMMTSTAAAMHAHHMSMQQPQQAMIGGWSKHGAPAMHGSVAPMHSGVSAGYPMAAIGQQPHATVMAVPPTRPLSELTPVEKAEREHKAAVLRTNQATVLGEHTWTLRRKAKAAKQVVENLKRKQDRAVSRVKRLYECATECCNRRCTSHLSQELVTRQAVQMSGLGRQEREAELLKQLRVMRHFTKDSEPATKRRRLSYTKYRFADHDVCRKLFEAAFFVSSKTVNTICSHYERHGDKPRIHGLAGKPSNKTVSHQRRATVGEFLRKLAMDEGINVRAEDAASAGGQFTRVLPCAYSKRSIYAMYVAAVSNRTAAAAKAEAEAASASGAVTPASQASTSSTGSSSRKGKLDANRPVGRHTFDRIWRQVLPALGTSVKNDCPRCHDSQTACVTARAAGKNPPNLGSLHSRPEPARLHARPAAGTAAPVAQADGARVAHTMHQRGGEAANSMVAMAGGHFGSGAGAAAGAADIGNGGLAPAAAAPIGLHVRDSKVEAAVPGAVDDGTDVSVVTMPPLDSVAARAARV